MIFTSTGYEPKFIQRKRCYDDSAHICTYIYKFYSPVTRLFYIINADYHEHDFFAIKFYVKQHRGSKNKYSIITNKGDLSNILVTCANIIPKLLVLYPKSSFGFCGARTIDKRTQKVEDFKNNQRFRVYRQIVPSYIGRVTFKHIEYISVSSYLLLNRNNGKLKEAENNLKIMITSTYPNMPDIDV